MEIEGDDDEAIAAGENAVELSPLSSFYISWLSEQYRDAGDYNKAIELAESVLDPEPEYPVALLVLGWYTATRSLYEDPRIQALAKEAGLPLIPFPKD